MASAGKTGRKGDDVKLYRIVIGMVVATWLAVGCSEPSVTPPDTNDASVAALRAAADTANDSTAADLMTPTGIAGTVGALSWNESGSSCTGTLVARNLFLTAGRCVVDDDGPRDGTAKVWFKQRPTSEFEVDVAGIRYLNTDEPSLYLVDIAHGNDLAIVPLLEPVPEEIVEHVAPVFTGDIGEAMRARPSPTLSDAIQVGMGRDETGVAGERKWGYLTTLRPGNESLNGAPDPRLLAQADELFHDGRPESNTDEGDAGGPVFMKSPGGAYMLVAVTSGTSNGRQVKAFTGSLYGRNNAEWLVPMLGDDVDGDGVVDSADNCPPVRCAQQGLSWDTCRNTSQEDLDDDGVGDVCDNCPPSVCEELARRDSALADLFTCKNPDQANMDGDGLGDACDLCPVDPNGSSLDDADGDFVGDVCDKSADPAPYPSCNDGKACDNGYCIQPNRPGQSYGHCTEPRDGDGDGMPDDHDNCPEVFTTDVRNSNDLVERQARVAPRGDVCEAVPLFRIAEPTTKLLFEAPKQGTGESVADVFDIEGDGWIGCNEKCTKAPGTPILDGGVAFRFCDCIFNSEPLSLSECAERRCNTLGLASGPTSDWSDITVRRHPSGTPVSFAAPDVMEFNESTSKPARYSWLFYEDAKRGIVPSYDDGNELSVHGILASHVLSDELVEGRDRDSEGILRTVARLVRAPNYTVPNFSGSIPIAGCSAPRCLPYIRAIDEILARINPPAPGEIFESVRDSAILVFQDGIISLVRAGEEAVDATAHVEPEAAKILEASEKFAYLTPAENASLLDTTGNQIQFAALPREASGFTSPAILSVVEDTLETTARPPEATASSSTALELAAVTVPDSGRAVYSAIQNKIYVAGGSLLSAPWGRVRVYDFNSDTWSELETTPGFEVGESVLAMALDVAGARLFVLDLVSSDEARLSRIDLRTGEATTILGVPYEKRHERVSLGVDVDGAVVLVGSNPNYLQAWRFVVEGEDPKWLGSFEIEGPEVAQVLDDMVYRGDILAIPVSATIGYAYVDVGKAAFEERAGITTDLRSL